jgi:Tannase-like family of unknown function (DUF6351)
MVTKHSYCTLGSAFAFVTAVVLGLGCGVAGAKPDKDSRDLQIRTLSNRADLISGGDALVEIVLPPGVAANGVQVVLNERDITYQFAIRADGRFLGLVDGLKIGKNKLTAKAKGTAVVKLTITNYPIGGPIFSGSQVQPWICETETSGLGPSLDPQCNAVTKVDYLYRSSNPAKNGFLPYDLLNHPNDVRSTTTDGGKTVPYVIRRETGTLNRAVYSFAVLADPSKPVAPWLSPLAWNHKLYYVFQGGALPQHRQGPNAGFAGTFDPVSLVLSDLQLSLGFATASATLNVFGQNTNSVTSAETVVMLKERLIERLGEIRYTPSTGGSGGSIQQQLIANAYPGLLDGIQPSASFPDIWTTNSEAQDCSLLLRYFKSTSAQLWMDVTQQNAVMDNGNFLPGTCNAWVGNAASNYLLDTDWMNPTSASCFAPYAVGPGTPQPWMYDPVHNPTGARCTLQDYQVAMFGVRRDGFANRPYDNVGIEYGLKALNAGVISPEQFVNMNENIGGRDIDWHWTQQRSVADPFAVAVAYRSGQVNLGDNLSTVPIFDLRGCVNTEIHSCFHSFEMRARLQTTNGTSANQVVLLNSPPDVQFKVLDRWVAAIKADSTSDALAVKVVRNKPADAFDACWINNQQVTDMSVCAAANPYFGDPRIGAGAALDDGVTKCQLGPLLRGNFSVSFTDGQWSRLRAAFPSGVCDWTKKSVGFTPLVPWLTFSEGPCGLPLGAAPESKPDDGNDDSATTIDDHESSGGCRDDSHD